MIAQESAVCGVTRSAGAATTDKPRGAPRLFAIRNRAQNTPRDYGRCERCERVRSASLGRTFARHAAKSYGSSAARTAALSRGKTLRPLKSRIPVEPTRSRMAFLRTADYRVRIRQTAVRQQCRAILAQDSPLTSQQQRTAAPQRTAQWSTGGYTPEYSRHSVRSTTAQQILHCGTAMAAPR